MDRSQADYVALSIFDQEAKPRASLCSTCVFPVLEGGVQTGCRFDRIAKFREQGVEVEPDEDGVHLKVVGRFCNAIRSPVWLEAQPDPSIKALGKTIRATNRATFTVVVRLKKGASIRKLYASLKSLEGRRDHVKHVAILLEDDAKTAAVVGRRLAKTAKYAAWDVINLLPVSEDADREYGGSTLLRGVDEVVRRSRAMFYTAADAGYEWPPGFFERVDEAVNVDLERFYCVGPANPNGDGFVAYRRFHVDLRIRGNIAEPIYAKAREAGEVEGVSWYCRDHHEFFQPKDENAA